MKRGSTLYSIVVTYIAIALLAGCSSTNRPKSPDSLIQQTRTCTPGQAGCCPDGQRYCNIGTHYVSDATWFDWVKHGFKLFTGAYPGKEALPKDLVLSEQDSARQLRQAYKSETSLTWFGHSTFLIRMGGRAIMTDPTISKRIGKPPLAISRLVPVRPPWELIKKLDAVIISHGDYDHLSISSLRMLGRKFPGLEVFVPEGSKRFLPDIANIRVKELSWHDNVKLGSVSLTFVPAVHGVRRPPYCTNSAHWGGYLLNHRGRKLYFSGDIAEGSIYRDIARRYGRVNTALIPIGGHHPQWFNRPFHATPRSSLKIARVFGAREAIPMHWGTFALSEDSGITQKNEILKASQTLPGAPKVSLFKIGQSRRLW